jgi:HlyD family secretion protein
VADPRIKTEAQLVIPANFGERSWRRERVAWTVMAAVVAVAALALALLGGRPRGPVYRTEAVQRRSISRQVEALGQLDVLQRFAMPSPGPGLLTRILVKPGDVVTRGELLAQLEDSAAALTVESRRESLRFNDGRVAEAQATLRSAADAGERAEGLSKNGLLSPSDLVAARATAEKARAALDAARAERGVAARALDLAEIHRQKQAVRAPADGVILTAPTELGAPADPEAKILFVVGSSLDSLLLTVSVAESDIAEVRPGQAAHFTVPAFENIVFTARITRLDPEPRRDHGSVTYSVTLLVPNPAHRLLPGMTATVRIDVARVDDALAVREAALRFRPEGGPAGASRARVWRLHRRGHLEEVPVIPGLSDGAYTEVHPQAGADLRVGDPVVIGVLAPREPEATAPGVSLGRR